MVEDPIEDHADAAPVRALQELGEGRVAAPRSWAAMTSTVLPDLLAQAAAAALTALVSASPELPIITVSLTGPVLVGWVPELLLLKPPPPQAVRARAPLAAMARKAPFRNGRAFMSISIGCRAVARVGVASARLAVVVSLNEPEV